MSMPVKNRPRFGMVSITSGAALLQTILEPISESENRAAYHRGDRPVCVHAGLDRPSIVKHTFAHG